jgi:hypothetical protein
MRPLFLTAVVLFFVAICGWLLVGCSEAPIKCSSMCVSDGWAQTADQCLPDDPYVRRKSCEEPVFRAPVIGESVIVYSADEERRTVLVEAILGDGEFIIGGPPAESELGSGVVAISDRALLGLVESVDDDTSYARVVDQ